MKPLKLIWTETALDDIEEIADFIAARNVSAARKLEDAILACAERLRDHPLMYRAGRMSGTREAVVHPNYLIVYQVSETEVTIMSVLHARQQYP